MAVNPATKWPLQTTPPNPGVYPYGSAQDITVPGDNTGTPWEKDLLDDMWGFYQQLLDAAGITPSGNPDQVGTSDYYDALRLVSGPVGTIGMMALNVTAASLGLRMLPLDGSGVLIANYAELDTVVYVGNPANPTADSFYHADDAAGTSRNTAGVYLILPDFRGQFVRGVDLAGAVDPDGGTRNMADYQGDAVLKHNHVIEDVIGGFFQYSGVFGNTGGSPNTTVAAPGASKAVADWEASAVHIGKDILGFTNITGVGEVDVENRPVNVNVNFGIWY